MRLSFSDRVRFWKKVQKYQSDECWIWQGSKTSAGYGQLWVDCKQVYAHRVSWEIHYEVIPDGMFVCHTCDNPICANPRHLFLGTASDNMRDMVAKGRNHNAKAAWTHCPRGHEFTHENTCRRATGRRMCRQCARELKRQHRRAA